MPHLNVSADRADSPLDEVSYCKIDCNTLKEVLSHCKGVPHTSTEETKAPHLGVHALEEDSFLSHFPNGMHISSPSMLYGSKEHQVNKEKDFFEYPSAGLQSHFGATHLKVAQPKLEAAKSLMLGDNVYTVASVSTNSIQRSKNDHVPAARTPTYTVVFLGELSVGKSALCKKFYKSGSNHQQNKMSTPDLFQQLDLTDDDDMTEAYSCESLDQMKHVDSHHVYERPVTVDGRCVRLRVLDINSEKHRNECGSECGDFEPFLGVGEAYALTYSIADRGTFQTVMEILSRMTSKHADALCSLPVILVGNKCDLVRNRQVSKADGIKVATKHNIKFIETSASLNENVTELFEGLIQQIQLRRSKISDDGGVAACSKWLATAETSLTKDINDKESKSTRKGSGSRKKRHPKRVFTRRLTEFLTGGKQDSKTQRAKSCQDLSVL